MENDVFVLLLGANEGAYALASSFAGDYGIPVCVMDVEIPEAFSSSKYFAETRTVSGIAYRGLFMRALSDFYESHAGKSVLLISTTEEYAARVLEEREAIERMFLLPQKKCQKAGGFSFKPVAMLLCYVGRNGDLHTVYGEIAVGTEEGKPLGVVTLPTPKTLLPCIPKDTPHFALYLVGENGETAVAPEEYMSFLAFPSAADLSLAEWILTDYVTCDVLDAASNTHKGLFTLFPFRKVKRYVLEGKKAVVRKLHQKRLAVTLYRSHRLRLHRFYREIWQKITKIKK